MTEYHPLKDFLLGRISTLTWTPLPELMELVAPQCRASVRAVMTHLEKAGVVWHSYEGREVDGMPVLISRYCRPHEIGDPLIGRKIVREAAE